MTIEDRYAVIHLCGLAVALNRPNRYCHIPKRIKWKGTAR